MMRHLRLGSLLVLGVLSMPVQALEFSFEDSGIDVSFKNRVTMGFQWRMEQQDPDLLGKTNVPGQQNLCTDPATGMPDGCVSLTGNRAPNDRLVNSPGAFSGVNQDDGNMNYNKGDLTAALFKYVPDLTVKFGENFLVRTRPIFFFDFVNAGIDLEDVGLDGLARKESFERHNDTRYQPARVARDDKSKRLFAEGMNLYDAYAQYSFSWLDRNATFSVGKQTVRWGESTLVAINSLSEINPPDANVLHQPALEISEVFQTTNVALLSTDLFEGVSAEFLYMLGWNPVRPDARGAFLSDNDLVGGADVAYLTLGQFGENPEGRPVLPAPLNLISNSTVTVPLFQEAGEPDSKRVFDDFYHTPGQYGVRLNYYADWLNGGTETSFYFLNYHSRYPYASLQAAQDSCARGLPATDLAQVGGLLASVTNPAQFLAAIQNAVNSVAGLADCNLPIAPIGTRDALPLDTVKAFIVYPEDIQMYGMSFNTNFGDYSLAGEFSYRPNVPLQVHITDVVFAALQPAFPENDIAVPGVAMIPGAETAVPSYLLKYRGVNRQTAGERVNGFERMKLGQLDLTVIRVLADNPFGAAQILWINEIGGTYVFDMPGKETLQFEGGGPNRTHASVGAYQDPDRFHLNPTTQIDGFADEFAWGIRSIARFEYNNVIFDWSVNPQIIAQWDIDGIAPFPMQNFVEGRKQFDVGADINMGQSLVTRLNYQWYTGGGRQNTRLDRDNASIAIIYTF